MSDSALRAPQFTYAGDDPVNNSDPSGQSVYGQCAGQSGEAAAACDEAVLYAMDYGPLPSDWLAEVNTVADVVGGAVIGGLVTGGNPAGVVGGAIAGYAVSKEVTKAGNYATAGYVGITLDGALAIPYDDVYSQPPYNDTGSTLAGLGGLQALNWAVVQYDPAFLWFQGMLRETVAASVLDHAETSLAEKLAKAGVSFTTAAYTTPFASGAKC